MKDYELTVLFHPDLEMNLDPALAKVKKIITGAKGKIVKESSGGKKRLAYRIQEQDYAIYHYFDLRLPKEAPHQVSKSLDLTDEVLRFLLITAREQKYEPVDEE